MRRQQVETEVIVPDTHGAHIDLKWRAAFLKDLKRLAPQRVIWLGDHVDCGGMFSTHQRTYTNEMAESYEDDLTAANSLLSDAQKVTPDADHHYIFGNHEGHVERWAARTYERRKDADAFVERMGVAARLELKERGIRFYKCQNFYQGLSVPGTIRFGRAGEPNMFYTHGMSYAKNACEVHLALFNDNVVFGHCHRSMMSMTRSVTKHAFLAACPGTGAQLQPLYAHTRPTGWSHGYGLRTLTRTGRFRYSNVPIYKGESLLGKVAA